jgi:hypothetical protein
MTMDGHRKTHNGFLRIIKSSLGLWSVQLKIRRLSTLTIGTGNRWNARMFVWMVIMVVIW